MISYSSPSSLTQSRHHERFRIHYTVDRHATPEDKDAWQYSTGFIDKDMVQQYMPIPSPETVVLMCGPPPMIKFACKANLDKLGFAPEDQVVF